jgi:putative NADH-flavin reductase
MTRIAVLGGTGYAGSHIVRAAAARGHQVTAYRRIAPEQPVDGVTYAQGSALDDSFLDQVLTDVYVVIHALAPRGDLEGKLEQIAADLATRAETAGVRLGVVGGAGTILAAPGGIKLDETPNAPAAFRPEAQTMDTILDQPRNSPESLDWFYITPGAAFGPWAPGEAAGNYRVGDDVILTDEEGKSGISGADFATATIDEIENPTHSRKRFTVAY